MIFGPFEYKNQIVLLNVSSSLITLIMLGYKLTIKYSISQQIPFLFSNCIDNLKNKPIDWLIDSFNTSKIDNDSSLRIILHSNRMFNNIITITSHNLDKIELKILERDNTDKYAVKLNDLIGDRLSLID